MSPEKPSQPLPHLNNKQSCALVQNFSGVFYRQEKRFYAREFIRKCIKLRILPGTLNRVGQLIFFRAISVYMFFSLKQDVFLMQRNYT